VRETHLGQVSARLFGLAALGVAAFAAHEKASCIGGIVGGGVIISGVFAFINGRSKTGAN
jgi:hypothetical protein